jgi:hypothetical protein
MRARRAKESTRSAKKTQGRFQAWEEGGVYWAYLQLLVF